MAQTFTDLCRERRQANRALHAFALGTFAETCVQIMRETMTQPMRTRIVIRWVLITAAVLSVEVVVAEDDPKLTALRNDPRCVFLAFENVVPFAGLQIRAKATQLTESVQAARAEIASRYLGPEAGERWAAQRTKPGVIVRLPLSAARTWDLSPILPE